MIAALALLAPSQAGAATSRQSEIEREKAALRQKIRDAEAKSKSISKQISESDARRAELERRLSLLSGQLADATNRLAAAEAALGVARNDLFSAEETLAESLKRLEQLQQEHNERARAIYRRGPANYLEVVLNSTSLMDFISRVTLVKGAMEEDTQRHRSVVRLSGQLSRARDRAADEKSAIEQQKVDIEAERNNITKIQSEVKRTRQQVVNELTNRKQLLSKVQAEKAEYVRRMQQLERESRSISALLKSRQAGQVYKSASGLVWPTTGPVVSGYGWRTHPIFGDRRLHAGIDISAPSGREVVSSLAGKVVFAGTQSGYGSTVVVDHGNAFATLYAHLSSISVSSGQSVGKGARVGAVGCTGYCTGPHLHFETRVNGDPVDPMQYF